MDPELEAARMRIYALQDGAIRAQALSFSLRKGLFELLSGDAVAFDTIAERLGLSPRVLPSLLAFLSSNGLIEVTQGGFRNSKAAGEFLVRGSPSYVGGRALLFAGFYEAIGHLPESLESGLPWTDAGQYDMFGGFTEEEQQWFAEGMASNAAHGARALLRQVDFGSFRRLLDVGGNTGGYAIPLARANPQLEVTIFDLPAVLELAESQIVAAGLQDRVTFTGGSFFEKLPSGFDAVLLSSILHDWEEEDCARILVRCHAALEPGGTIIVTEPMLADDFSGPDHPAASGLTMALLGGANRTRAQVAEMLTNAGFVDARWTELGAQNSTVFAQR